MENKKFYDIANQKIEDLEKKRENMILDLKSEIENLKEEIKTLSCTMEQCVDSMDFDGYKAAEENQKNANMKVSMLEKKLANIQNGGLVTDAESNKFLQEAVNYEIECEKKFYSELEPVIKQLQKIQKEYEDSIVNTGEVIRKWIFQIHACPVFNGTNQIYTQINHVHRYPVHLNGKVKALLKSYENENK